MLEAPEKIHLPKHRPMVERASDGSLHFRLHRGQRRAWTSLKRFVIVIAGSQSGKTVLGPLWMWNEIQRRGPGDYLVVAPHHTLLNLKALPEFLKLFKRTLRLGEYKAGAKMFVFSDEGAERTFGYVPEEPTQVFFGHASNPESLESATAKAAWLDEAGQNEFKLGSWEAIQRRLSIHEGRVLISTTPYSLGWLKQQLYDPWVKAGRNHPTIDLIQFKSLENPTFPRAEYERRKAEMQPWRFRMFYDGEFERPAGAIYDCFDTTQHVVPWFKVPAHWHRHVGIDFGGVNTAAVFIAEEMAAPPGDYTGDPDRDRRTGRLIVYREYHEGSRTAKQHGQALKQGEPRTPNAVGGSNSEGQWRSEFAAGGLPVRKPPLPDVEVGINAVYSLIQRGELVIMASCEKLIDEVQNYTREVDDSGNPTEKIADKDTFHLADALRYIAAWFHANRRQGPGRGPSVATSMGSGPRATVVPPPVASPDPKQAMKAEAKQLAAEVKNMNTFTDLFK